MDRAPSSSIPPDALVSHAGFVRRIAFAILHDDADADDATQATLARGLTAGPADTGARRSWLATVVRNQARRLMRREARVATRERAASRPEATADVADAVVRQETLRAVVDAVGSLDEPSRTVVLLRHYDDLPPREIAARLGLPVETVKKRLHRAHQTLRTRLEGEGRREGERRWSALAAFAGWNPPSGAPLLPTAKGALVATGMKTGTVVVVGVLTAVAAGTWWAFGRGDKAPSITQPAAPAATAALPSAPPPLAPRGLTAERTAPPAPAAAPAREIPRSWAGHERGRVTFRLPREMDEKTDAGRAQPEMGRWVGPVLRDAIVTWSILPRAEADARSQQLIEGTESAIRLGDRDATERRGLWKGDGALVRARVIRLEARDAIEEPLAFWLSSPVEAPPEVDALLDTLISTVRVTPLLATVAVAAGDVPGDVIEVAVFLDGVPQAGTATIEAWGTDLVFQEDGSWGLKRGPAREFPLARDGRVRFDALAAGYYEVTVRGPNLGGHRITTQVSGKRDATQPRLVLALSKGWIRGRAFTRDGRPAAGSIVRLHPMDGGYGSLRVVGEAVVDDDGRYELRGVPRSGGIVSLELPVLDGMPQAPRQEAAFALKADEPRLLDLGTEVPLPVWTGRVLEADGRAAEGPGRLSLVRLDPRPGRSEFETAIIRKDGRFAARVEPGRYRVTGEMLRPDAAPRTVVGIDVLEVSAPGLERDLVVGGSIVQVRARRPDGTAVQGIDIDIEPVGPTRSWSRGMTTDAAGRVQFQGIPAGRYRITALHDGTPLPGRGSTEIEVSPPTPVTGVELEVPDR